MRVLKHGAEVERTDWLAKTTKPKERPSEDDFQE
jgi:hypothetical protein